MQSSFTIEQLYENRNYIGIYNLIEQGQITDVLRSYLLFALFETNQLSNSLEVFNEITDFNNKSIDYSRLFGYVGLIYYAMGNSQLSTQFLDKAYLSLGEFSNESKDWIELLGIRNNFFRVVETEKIVFHIDKRILKSEEKKCIASHEAYNYSIQHFFQITLRKKIDIYVYIDWKDVIGNNLSYTNSVFAMIHVNLHDSSGHEIAHVYHENMSKDVTSSPRMIREGIAEYFDESIVYKSIKFPEDKVSIKLLWGDFSYYRKELAYLLSKLFVSVLVERLSTKQFIDFLKHPTIENGYSILGAELDCLFEETEQVYRNRYMCTS